MLYNHIQMPGNGESAFGVVFWVLFLVLQLPFLLPVFGDSKNLLLLWKHCFFMLHGCYHLINATLFQRHKILVIPSILYPLPIAYCICLTL